MFKAQEPPLVPLKVWEPLHAEPAQRLRPMRLNSCTGRQVFPRGRFHQDSKGTLFCVSLSHTKTGRRPGAGNSEPTSSCSQTEGPRRFPNAEDRLYLLPLGRKDPTLRVASYVHDITGGPNERELRICLFSVIL
jgi:hypothetical protein